MAMAGLSEIRRPVKRFKDLRIGSWNVLSLYSSKSLRWEDGVTEDDVTEDDVTEDDVTEDDVTEDARKLRERNWRNAARNRDSWQKLLKKALAQRGLLCQWWWWWWWFILQDLLSSDRLKCFHCNVRESGFWMLQWIGLNNCEMHLICRVAEFIVKINRFKICTRKYHNMSVF